MKRYVTVVSDEHGLPRAWGISKDMDESIAEADRQWNAYVEKKAAIDVKVVRGKRTTQEVADDEEEDAS